MKTWKILRDCRLKGDGVHHAMLGIARLHNLALARAPVERGMARLKSWQIFHRSRISPNRMTVIAKAVLTLERQR